MGHAPRGVALAWGPNGRPSKSRRSVARDCGCHVFSQDATKSDFRHGHRVSFPGVVTGARPLATFAPNDEALFARMIYRLDPVYLERLEGQKNLRMFYGHSIALGVFVVSISQLGIRAAPLAALAFGASAFFHWKLDQIHAQNMKSAEDFEVEVVDGYLVFRSAVDEHRLFLKDLESARQASRFEPIKLVFSGRPPLKLEGLRDAHKLVDELAGHVR